MMWYFHMRYQFILVQEEFYRTMQGDKRYATLILQSLLDHKQSNDKSTDIQSKLQQKLTALETNYSKMESDYFKKIKDLKNILTERNRKQASLNSQINMLREQFKLHQQEIIKITQQLANEKGKSNEPKQQKKNSSPGLLKKSLQNEKKVDKRMSPAMHNQPNTNLKINKNQGNCPMDETSRQIESKKGFSPSNNINKITQFFSNHNHSESITNQNIKGKNIVQPDKNANINRSPQGQNKKANYSPKASIKSSNDLKGFLINSLKNFEKEKPLAVPNGSPKRILRKSPGQGIAKVQKKLLGNLKESVVQQAF